MRTLAVFVLLWLLAGCGKIGDPLPPFIRIPEDVKDLAASQAGYNIVVEWTNPARYVDGSLATDLAEAELRRNGAVVVSVPVTGAGMRQSHTIDVRNALGVRQAFVVQITTVRGRASNPSNEAAIEPVEVPGPVRNLTAVVDQGRIRLQWETPSANGALAQVYIVQRDGRPSQDVVADGRFEDEGYEAGVSYTYRVTAARREPVLVPGTAAESVTVEAVDRVAPQSPSGLQAVVSGNGAFLTWTPNDETDLAGYRIVRSERADAGFAPLEENLHPTSGFFDPASRSGLYYAVTAVDESGNESPRSMSVPLP